MKKLLFLTAIAIAVVSCKKEQPTTPGAPKGASTEELVADLIKRADKDLYAQMYDHNQRLPHVGVDIIHGVFVWRGNPANGTCLPHATNPCMILISGLTTDEDSPIGIIAPGQINTFLPQDNARLVRNLPEPTVETVTELRTVLNENGETEVTVVN